jgi:hypothetical protein
VAIQCGDAFILGLGGHLWVVISEPVKHAGHFVIVNLTTDVFRAGTECELMPGDHQWIREKCYVSFGDAREVTPRQGAQIVAHMATGAIIKQYPVTHAVLQKIIEAAKKSKALPIGLITYF